MNSSNWLLYGATGFTGELIVEEAVRQGMKPVIAGRSEARIREMAEKFGVEWKVFPLDDPQKIRAGIRGFACVLHAAGPFIHTAEPMMLACIDEGAHYLDITGEIPVFQIAARLGSRAEDTGIALIPGVGFDVVPTDCLARYVADASRGSENLEIAFAAISNPSQGTAKSAIEMMPRGFLTRRNGELQRISAGSGGKKVRFSDKERYVLPVSWGDLETAFHSTGIANITTYTSLSRGASMFLRALGPVMMLLFKFSPVRGLAKKFVDLFVRGPGAREQKDGRSYVYVKVSSAAGKSREAWLETIEGYVFTAKSALLCVREVIEKSPKGFKTPSVAFGYDLVLRIPGTRILDSIESQ